MIWTMDDTWTDSAWCSLVTRILLVAYSKESALESMITFTVIKKKIQMLVDPNLQHLVLPKHSISKVDMSERSLSYVYCHHILFSSHTYKLVQKGNSLLNKLYKLVYYKSVTY